jgi:hypothetical protein
VAEKVGEDLGALTDIETKRKFSELLAPVSALCKAAIEWAGAFPSEAERESQKLMAAAEPLLDDLVSGGAPKAVVDDAKDQVALTLMHCAIAFGNKTEKWKVCIALLERGLELASTAATRERVEKNLEIVRKNDKVLGELTPISSAPSLATINGFGVTLYGMADTDPETGSYMATYYLVLLFVPVFPICRYRVISTGNGYRFLGKAPLRTFDKWHIAVSVIAIIWVILQAN